MEESEMKISAHVEKPLIWHRLTAGIRIEDLLENRFEEARSLMKEHFFVEETLCRGVKLSTDPVSVDSYLETMTFWMSDKMSLCAVDEETGTLVGVLLARAMYKTDYTLTYSRVRISQGETFQRVAELRSHMTSSFDVYDHYDVDCMFFYDAICVHPDHRGKGTGMALLHCGEKVAKYLKMPAVVGIFTSLRSQTLARKFGMDRLLEITYSSWLKDNCVVFDDPGAGNYSAMLMGKMIHLPELTRKKSFTLGQGLKPLLQSIDDALNFEKVEQ